MYRDRKLGVTQCLIDLDHSETQALPVDQNLATGKASRQMVAGEARVIVGVAHLPGRAGLPCVVAFLARAVVLVPVDLEVHEASACLVVAMSNMSCSNCYRSALS